MYCQRWSCGEGRPSFGTLGGTNFDSHATHLVLVLLVSHALPADQAILPCTLSIVAIQNLLRLLEKEKRGVQLSWNNDCFPSYGPVYCGYASARLPTKPGGISCVIMSPRTSLVHGAMCANRCPGCGTNCWLPVCR